MCLFSSFLDYICDKRAKNKSSMHTIITQGPAAKYSFLTQVENCGVKKVSKSRRYDGFYSLFIELF